MNLRALASSLIALALVVSSAEAQDFDAMIQQQLQLSNQMSAQMQQQQNNMIQQNMQNPQIQQMYQQYLQRGGQMTFQQFAYSYAATGGFSQEGMRRYNESESEIQQRDQQAVQAYRQNQQNNAQAMQQMQNRQDEIARYRGNLLNGTSDYTDPSSGARYNLPNTQPQGSMYRDPSSGETFYNGPLGQQYRGNGNDTWQQLDEDE